MTGASPDGDRAVVNGANELSPPSRASVPSADGQMLAIARQCAADSYGGLKPYWDGIRTNILAGMCDELPTVQSALSALRRCYSASWERCPVATTQCTENECRYGCSIQGPKAEAGQMVPNQPYRQWFDGERLRTEPIPLEEFYSTHAQGIEAATADETQRGSAVGESPVTEGDAPKTPLSTPLPSGSIER